MTQSQSYRKLLRGTIKAVNDRERMRLALHKIFDAFGVPEGRQKKIIEDVRACDFDSLNKLTKAGGMVDINTLVVKRKELGLSLDQAASKIGCTKPHLHGIEKGKTSNPGADILNGFVAVYGLTPIEVLEIFKH